MDGEFETPNGIPVEVLKKILSNITELQNIWQLRQVNHVFKCIVWSNVRKLKFVFEHCRPPDASQVIYQFEIDSIHILQNDRDPKVLGGDLQKAMKIIPTIWRNSLNLATLEFGAIVPHAPHVAIYGSFGSATRITLFDFSSMIQSLQQQSPHKIRHIVLDRGFEQYPGFADVIASCSSELESLQTLRKDSFKLVDDKFVAAIAMCVSLKKATLDFPEFLPALLSLNSLKEINCSKQNSSTAGNCSVVVDMTDKLILRMDLSFFTACIPLKIHFDFSRVTSLVISADFEFENSLNVYNTLLSFPNAEKVIILITMHDSELYHDIFDIVQNFFDIKNESKFRRMLAIKVHKNKVARPTEVLDTAIVQAIQRGLNVGNGRIVTLKDVEMHGGVEVDGNDFDGNDYWKWEVGCMQCFIGPIMDVD